MSSVGSPSLSAGSSLGVSVLNQTFFTLNGVSWGALIPNNDGSIPYSLTVKGTKYRFEVKDGQNYQTMAFSDPAYVLRSEVYGPAFPFNTNVTFAFDLLVRSQNPQPTTNQWYIVGQIHCDNNVVGGSPPIAFDVQPDPGGPTGEKLQFDLNSQIAGHPVVYTNVGSIPFSRNRLYRCQWVYRDAQGQPTGFWQISIDGVVVLTYNGVTGYATAVAGSYPKWGIYSGGNGAVATATPLPGQDIVVEYDNVTFTGLVPAFHVAPSGNDGSAGTITAPFLTVDKSIAAMTASGSIKTTYVHAGVVNTSTMALGTGQSLLPYPGDPPLSATVHCTTPNLGASGVSGITIKGLRWTFTGSGANLLFNDCPALKIQGNKSTCVGNQNFLQIFRPGNGFRVQGNDVIADTWNAAGAIFPLNIIDNPASPTNRDDWIVSDNTLNGGTFPIQAQVQGASGIYTNVHFDRNFIRGYGSNSSTVGNIAMSIVLSNNPANHSNTCTDNDSQPAAGVGAAGVEAGLAGCTYRNKIVANFGYSISKVPNSLFDGSDLTIGSMAFSNAGPSYDGVNFEIRTNTINGSVRAGAWTPTNLSPLPSATGIATNTPSPVYVP